MCLAESVPADCEYMVMSAPTDEGYLDMAAPTRRADGKRIYQQYCVVSWPNIFLIKITQCNLRYI